MAQYYDVAAFLQENERVPAKFRYTVPNLGFMANQHDRHLNQGTVVELPYWLGLDLARMENRDFLTLGLPKPYTSRVRAALAASSQAVHLRTLSANFYSAGVQLDDAIQDDTLKQVLHRTFLDRIEEVFDQAQHASSAPSSSDAKASSAHQQPIDEKAADFVAGMDEWEKELFAAAETAAKDTLNWAASKHAH